MGGIDEAIEEIKRLDALLDYAVNVQNKLRIRSIPTTSLSINSKLYSMLTLGKIDFLIKPRFLLFCMLYIDGWMDR